MPQASKAPMPVRSMTSPTVRADFFGFDAACGGFRGVAAVGGGVGAGAFDAPDLAAEAVDQLPVVEDGKLVGLLSIGDLVKEAIAEQADLIRQLEQYIRGE